MIAVTSDALDLLLYVLVFAVIVLLIVFLIRRV